MSVPGQGADFGSGRCPRASSIWQLNDAVHSATAIDNRALRYSFAVPAVLYVVFSVVLSANVPLLDDFLLLDSIVDLHQAPDPIGFLRLLVEPHYEHRIVTTRLLGYLASLLPGGLDFRLLLLLSDAALIGALALLGRMLRLGRRPELWLILFALVLQPQLQKLMVYTMGATLANFGVLFSLLYVDLTLRRGREHLALLALLCAMLTTAAGFALPLLGLLILVPSRRFGLAIITLVIAALGWAIYLVGNVQDAGASLPFAIHHPLLVARFFLGMLGSAAEVPLRGYEFLSTYTILALGVALAVQIGRIAARIRTRHESEADRYTIPTVVLLAYCMLIMGTIAIDRVIEYQNNVVAASLDGRYRLYGLLILAICAVDIVRRAGHVHHPGSLMRNAIVAGSVLFCGCQYALSFPELREGAKAREAAFQHWRQTGDSRALSRPAGNSADPGRVLSRAAQLRVFRPSG